MDYGVLQSMFPGPMLGLCAEALQVDEWEGSGLYRPDPEDTMV